MNTESREPVIESKQKSIRSYVIRGGRITEAQRRSFDQHWQTFGLSLHDGLMQPQDTFGRNGSVIVEVGFGMGDSLLEMAINEPDNLFIGIEVHPPGVGALLNNASKAGVENLRIYMADAIDVLSDCIEDGSLDRFQLYFPDPWPKKKHHKRRIVQTPFVELIKRKLRPNGILHMATDWEPYAEYMSEVLEGAEGLTNTATGSYAERPDFRPVTKFEKRGERLGHGVWDLLYSRTPE